MFAYLTALAALAVLALTARRIEGSWIAPATIWPIGWLAYALAALPVIGAPHTLVPALLWILLNCSCFLGAAAWSRAAVSGASRPVPHTRRYRGLGVITATLAVAGLLALISAVHATGFALRDVVSLPALARMAAASRITFTFGRQQQDIVARALLVLAYTGTPFAGLYFHAARRPAAKVLALVPLAAIILIGFVTGSRMGVLFGGALWLGAYLSASLLGTDDPRREGLRLFGLIGALVLLLLVGGSVAVQFVRYFTGSERSIGAIVAEPFGFLASFGRWFESSGIRATGLTGGFYSFERLARALGGDWPTVQAIDVGFTTSNLQTVFRGLIEDFGTVGSLVVVGATGFLSSIAFRRVVAGYRGWLAALTLTYAMLFTSAALSAFAYVGPMIAGAAFTAYVALMSYTDTSGSNRVAVRSSEPVAGPSGG
ncbi:MAG: hypothetical protein ACREK8_10290 [Gemmatimonadales bacterium]